MSLGFGAPSFRGAADMVFRWALYPLATSIHYLSSVAYECYKILDNRVPQDSLPLSTMKRMRWFKI